MSSVPRRAIALGLAALSAGCATGGAGGSKAATARAPEPPSVARVELPPSVRQGMAPDILRPEVPEDAVLARVEGIEIRKSQVFDRLLESDRLVAETWLDALLLDLVIAAIAEREGVDVDPAWIDQRQLEEEELLRAQAQVETGVDDLEAYLASRYALTPETYRATLRRDLARIRFRSLVVRLVGWREERVTVQYLIASDRAALDRVRGDVALGADLLLLGRRLRDEDEATEARYDLGTLGPFGEGFSHPLAQRALQMEQGGVSDVFEISEGRFAVLTCLRREAARAEPFAEIRGELAAEIDRRPVTPFEQQAFAIRYGGSETVLPDASTGR